MKTTVQIDPSSIPAIAIAAIVAVLFPYDRCDRGSLFLAIAAIMAIVTIIWKPGFRGTGNPLDTLNDFIEFYSRYRFR